MIARLLQESRSRVLAAQHWDTVDPVFLHQPFALLPR
jgi:hypothetical protein